MLHSCVHRCRRWGRGLQGQDLKVFEQTQNLSRAQKSHIFKNFIRNNKLIVLYLIWHLLLGTNSSAGSGTSTTAETFAQWPCWSCWRRWYQLRYAELYTLHVYKWDMAYCSPFHVCSGHNHWWRHNSEAIRDTEKRRPPRPMKSSELSNGENFCKTVIYDVIIWFRDGNCKNWLERILVLVRLQYNQKSAQSDQNCRTR